MKFRTLPIFLTILAATVIASVFPAGGQGTAFVYQGMLNRAGFSASGTYDLSFGLYTSGTGGSPASPILTNSGVVLSNGLFMTTLDFGNAFSSGSPYWLEIGVRTNASDAFTLLTPRQPFTSTPYAITAKNLAGMLPASQLSGTLPFNAFTGSFPNPVTLSNTGNFFTGNFSGSFTGNGAGITNLTPLVYNVRDYGAGRGLPSADSAGIRKAFDSWVRTGGVLFFPPGIYYDTNNYVITNAPQWDSWEDPPLSIVGSGSAATLWKFFGFNSTLIDCPQQLAPQVIQGITFMVGQVYNGAIGFGTNNCIMLRNDAGHAIWNDVRFMNWGGCAVHWESGAGGRFYGLQFLYCGTGISLYGYDDGTILDAIGYGCTNAVVELGQAEQWSGHSVSRVVAPKINIFGGGNRNAVIVGNGGGARISGYVENSSNAIVQIGHEDGSDSNIQSVTISELGGLNFGSEVVCKLYSPCSLLTIRNIGAFPTNVLSTTPATDLTPIIFESPNTGILEIFSDGTIVPSGSGSIATVNLAQNSYQKTPGAVAQIYSQQTSKFSFSAANASLDAQGNLNTKTVLGRRTTTSPSAGGTYLVDLGIPYQDVFVTSSVNVDFTSLSLYNQTNAGHSRVLFFPGASAATISFSTNNLSWLSQSGTGSGPTSIPGGRALIVDLNPEITPARTNIWASYNFAPYVP